MPQSRVYQPKPAGCTVLTSLHNVSEVPEESDLFSSPQPRVAIMNRQQFKTVIYSCKKHHPAHLTSATCVSDPCACHDSRNRLLEIASWSAAHTNETISWTSGKKQEALSCLATTAWLVIRDVHYGATNLYCRLSAGIFGLKDAPNRTK